jgi:hypothetical protein
MPRRAVLLLATIGACCGFAITPSTRASALDIHTPQVKVPTPHINVPTPTLHPTAPKLNDRHSTSSTTGSNTGSANSSVKGTGSPGANALTGGSSSGTGSPGVKTVTGGSSNGTGSPGVKTLTGGSSNGTGSPGVKTLTGGSPNGIGPNGANALTGSSNGTGSPGIMITNAPVAGPFTTNNPPANSAAGSGAPISTTATPILDLLDFYNFYVFFPFVNIASVLGDTAGAPTSVGGLANSLTNGSDGATYSAVISADQANIAAAKQAQTTAAACAVDSSLAGCSSAESVQQATANLTNAENALQDFFSDINYLLWLYSLMESGFPLPPGFSPAAAAAVEAAVASCLASPSTCDSTIAQLETVLAELGVPAQLTLAGETFAVLQPPSEIAQDAPYNVTPGGPDSSLSDLLDGYFASWGFIGVIVGAG